MIESQQLTELRSTYDQMTQELKWAKSLPVLEVKYKQLACMFIEALLGNDLYPEYKGSMDENTIQKHLDIINKNGLQQAVLDWLGVNESYINGESINKDSTEKFIVKTK